MRPRSWSSDPFAASNTLEVARRCVACQVVSCALLEFPTTEVCPRFEWHKSIASPSFYMWSEVSVPRAAPSARWPAFGGLVGGPTAYASGEEDLDDGDFGGILI